MQLQEFISQNIFFSQITLLGKEKSTSENHLKTYGTLT
jgi:hypothetical protein